MLYGMFNNVHVKATEIKTGESVTSVKLEFSFKYFADETSSAEFNRLVNDLTGNTDKSILTSANTDIKKVKAIHDYIIKRSHVSTDHSLTLEKGGSPHAYALWTYKLLKEAKIEVRYVSGMSNGKKHSWNLVKVGTEWYHLDIAANDDSKKDSKDIKYRYFLAANKTIIDKREITYGEVPSLGWGEAYTAFEKIENPAQADNVMYYANKASNSEILKLELDNSGGISVKTPPNISGATSGFGKILYYNSTSADSTRITTNEYLYFINDAKSKHLYQYDITNEKLQLIIEEPIESISIIADKLEYKPINGLKKQIDLNEFKDFNRQEVDKVIQAIKGLNYNGYTNFNELKSAVTSADTAFINLGKDKQALIPAGIEEILKEYNKAVIDIERIQSKINSLDLDNGSSKVDVSNVRNELNQLNSIHKKFVNDANLITQEKRIEATDLAERVQKVTEAIKKLSDNSTYAEVKLVHEQYIALGVATSQVTNKDELLKLWDKVGTEKAAIDHVNKLIEELSLKSKKKTSKKLKKHTTIFRQPQKS